MLVRVSKIPYNCFSESTVFRVFARQSKDQELSRQCSCLRTSYACNQARFLFF